MTPAEAGRIRAEADLLVTEQQVAAAVRRVAEEISAALRETHPLVFAVMSGAAVFAGHLLPLLDFPLDFDCLHVSRYGDATAGGALSWIAPPRAAVAGRTVLVLDDILDEGVTLAAIKRRLLEQGAQDCRIAVFADKDIGRDKPAQADFVGVRLPNRYVFGFGMDVGGAWRNLPAVYAVKGL
ncbi:MAG: hypoxanthine-guanine phosphoribosyltransferase [Zoogloeaceae bacterium]|jgi:hypoxanthine phosphoribosyltransferase|nr:hypoxanthine-guanine phosphoribosyltransferase [Zoogloeaceae bacterium]